MGADLIIEAACFKHKHDETDKKFWDSLRTEYTKLLDTEKVDYSDFEAETGNEMDKEKAVGVIKEFFDTLEGWSRDVTWIKVGEYTIYITGGMSWGDAPTESYDTFVDFLRLFPYDFVDDILGE